MFRKLRKFTSEAEKRLYVHSFETSTGIEHIRAFEWQYEFLWQHFRLLDSALKPYYYTFRIKWALQFVLQSLTAMIALVLGSLALTMQDNSPGNQATIGVAFLVLVFLDSELSLFTRLWSEFDLSEGPIARVQRICATLKAEQDTSNCTTIPPEWPHRGNIEFKNVTATYG